MLKPKVKKIGFGITMDVDLVSYLDEQVKEHKVNRSIFLSHLVEEYMIEKGVARTYEQR